MAYVFTLTLLYLFPVQDLRVTDILIQQDLTAEVSSFIQFYIIPTLCSPLPVDTGSRSSHTQLAAQGGGGWLGGGQGGHQVGPSHPEQKYNYGEGGICQTD